jgi:hypothetical protein
MTTQTEREFMIDSIIADLTTYLMQDYNMSVEKALSTIYNSEYYDRLNNINTGLYYESSPYNYHYLKHEIDYGKMA